jgi:hypothetical protein
LNTLTDEEAQKFIMALAYTRKEEGFTEEEAQVVLDWAHGAVVDHALFTAVLNGDMFPDVKEGEVVFGITDQGAEYAKSILMGGGTGQERIQ